jgi:Histidine phosphatase superfamily (branch 1)
MAGFADDASLERSNPVGSFIVVSHGVTIRCFRMQWMHYPWEWYEREKNPRNCSIQLIEVGPDQDTMTDSSSTDSSTPQNRPRRGARKVTWAERTVDVLTPPIAPSEAAPLWSGNSERAPAARLGLSGPRNRPCG